MMRLALVAELVNDHKFHQRCRGLHQVTLPP
jgi:hypothetical protein